MQALVDKANFSPTHRPNNETGHWGVFFAKSMDGGKTLGKTIMLSAPNKGHVVDLNVDIAAQYSKLVSIMEIHLERQ